MKILMVKKLHEDAIVPQKERECDEGYDIFSIEEKLIMPGKHVMVSTGISAWACEVTDVFVNGFREELFENKYWIQIEGRSGLASKGIFPIGGIVDSGYRGEIKVMLVNTGVSDFKIEKGDKIAQLIIREHMNFVVEEVDELPDGERGDKGFGSSGNKAKKS
jgi:dUTP pyrophosphatase